MIVNIGENKNVESIQFWLVSSNIESFSARTAHFLRLFSPLTVISGKYRYTVI